MSQSASVTLQLITATEVIPLASTQWDSVTLKSPRRLTPQPATVVMIIDDVRHEWAVMTGETNNLTLSIKDIEA